MHRVPRRAVIRPTPLCLAVSLSLSVSFCLSLPLSLPLSISHSLSISVSVCLFVGLSLYVCVFLSLSLLLSPQVPCRRKAPSRTYQASLQRQPEDDPKELGNFHRDLENACLRPTDMAQPDKQRGKVN